MGVLMEPSQVNQQRAELKYRPTESSAYMNKIRGPSYPFHSSEIQENGDYRNGYSPIKEAGLDYSVKFVTPSMKEDDMVKFTDVCYAVPPKLEVLDLKVSSDDGTFFKKESNYYSNDNGVTATIATHSPLRPKLELRDVAIVDSVVKCEGGSGVGVGDNVKNGLRRPCSPTTMPPPKKKWMKNYMEEEPCGILVQQIHQPRNGLTCLNSVSSTSITTTNHNGSNGLISSRAPPPSAPISIPPSHHAPTLHLLDHHDQPRARSNSNGSGGGRAAGTREVHNKLEKNRRAHLKECFELLKKQLPSSAEDKKTSNLFILDSAIRYIQSLKRRERECEHEMERLAREKIASQQKLAALKQGTSPITPTLHLPSNHDREAMSEGDEPMVTPRMNSLIMSSPGSTSSLSMSLPEHSSNGVLPPSPPSSLDLSTRQPHLLQHAHLQNSSSNHLSQQQLRPTHHTLQHAALSQPLQVLTSQQPSTTMYIGQTPSPPHSSPNITRLPQPAPNSIITTQQIITSPFQQSQHIVNSIVATPGTLNLTVNPSIKTTRGPPKAVVAPGLPTLTVTTVNHGPVMAVNPTNVQPRQQVQSVDRKILTTVSSPVNGQTTLVHPAQLHLPISQVMNGSSLVMSPAIQMIYATPQTLRMLQGQGGAVAPVDLPSTAANSPVARQVREVQKIVEPGVGGVSMTTATVVSNGRTTAAFPASMMTQAQNNHLTHHNNNGNHHQTSQHITVKTQPEDPQTQIMMNGLTPLLMSKGGTHIIAAPHLTGKVVSSPILKAVNAQYLSAANSVKPVVVVSTGNGLPIQQSQSIVPSSATVPSSSSSAS